MPVLRLQQPRPRRGRRRGALPRRLQVGDRSSGRARARPRRPLGLLRRRHAVAHAPGDRRRRPRRDRGEVDGRAGRRDHARSQSDQRRGGTVSRLPRRRSEPAFDRRAGARRRRPQGAGAETQRRGGACGGASRGVALPPLHLRSHLRAPGSGRAGVARRAGQRPRSRRRPHFALPAHHRAGHRRSSGSTTPAGSPCPTRT